MLWSMEIAGRHDYKFILNAVRSDLERLDAEIASDIERATRSSQIQPVSVDVEPDADE
jgi:hypothetical protein